MIIANLKSEPEVVTLTLVDRTKRRITVGPRGSSAAQVQVMDNILMTDDLINKIRNRIISVIQ